MQDPESSAILKYLTTGACFTILMLEDGNPAAQSPLVVENADFSLVCFGPGSHDHRIGDAEAVLDVHLGTTEGTVVFDSDLPTPTTTRAHTFSFIPSSRVRGMKAIRSGPSVLMVFLPSKLAIIPAREAIMGLEEPIWNRADAAMIGAGIIVQDYLQTPHHQVRAPETRFLRDLLSIRLLQVITNQKKSESRTGASRPVQRTLEFIDRNLGEKLSLEAIAAVAGMSPFHFARVFRGALGVSVKRYVLLHRIERAQCLIAATDLSLAQIALLVGFSSQSHMTALFTQFVGRTPHSFRKHPALVSSEPVASTLPHCQTSETR